MTTNKILFIIAVSFMVSFTLLLDAQTVSDLKLVNAISNADIRSLTDGDEIDLAEVGSSLNIRAEVTGTVGSVKFEYDEANIGPFGNSQTAIEGVAPYAMRGDEGGDYSSWTPSLGSHTLKVTAYSEGNAGGTAGTPVNINFTVVNNGGTAGGTDGGADAVYNLPADPGTGEYTIEGELKKWHKITLSFDGPNHSETDIGPNPFLDYRLNVTFTNGSKSYLVPGYFAVDGNAAESSATSGNVWRVHFTPDEEGTWNWSASFRIGGYAAVNLDELYGKAVSPIDGNSGSFEISATDKTGRDLRSKGRLEYVGEHYLRFAETGEYFIKGGPDAPENFLAYEDFDGSFKSDGESDDKIKSWSFHERDWQAGDPSWQGGKGTEIIGAVNYLASEGLNSFSFLAMNINGDDKNVFPYISSVDFKHMDCSKLDQWGILFDHAMEKGMYLHFKTQEVENETLLDNGETGTNRKLYYRELVARFGYHLALNWNLGEENKQTSQQQIDMAQYFYDIDPYHHNIVMHTWPGEYGLRYTPLLGDNSKLTGVSLQVEWDNVHKITGDWVSKSAAAGKKWIVANDEQGGPGIGVPHDNHDGTPNLHNIRKQTLWGNLMAGGAGVEYYFGYQLPHSDLNCQDFRSRDLSWDFVRYALEFFQNNEIPFWQMSQNDNLVTSGWCLADEGQAYVVYLRNGGNSSLNLNIDGTYDVRWYDPRKGGNLQSGSVTSISGTGSKALGDAPNNTNEDWVILVLNSEGVNSSPIAIAEADSLSGEAPLEVNFDASGSTDSDGSILSYSWDFGDGKISSSAIVSNEFTEPGTYEVHLTITDNEGASGSDIIYVNVEIPQCGSFTEMKSKDFPLGGFYLDNYTGTDLLAIQPETLPVTASTEMEFTGESCMYNITFHGVGESDGQSSFELFINDVSIGSYTLPYSTLGYEFGDDYNMYFPNVSVNKGDIIKVEGTTGTDGSEWSRARWLKIAFTPLGQGNSGCGADFVEQDGIVVVEVESIAPVSGWAEESSVPGFTGDSYFRWDGADLFNSPGSGLLEYSVRINNPGTYHFRWHSKIMHGTDPTESNDSWLKIPDADDFFATNGSVVKYPGGGMFVQSNTVTNGASSGGWMKVFSSGTTNWTWVCRTSDHEDLEIFATFNQPGVYTVQISARSKNHAIDRFVLFKDDTYTISQATNLSLEETKCMGGSNPSLPVLTVNYGMGSGSYEIGTKVNILADDAPMGKIFDKWTGDVANVANLDSSSTQITMGADDAVITASYKNDPKYKYTLTVYDGSGSGEYTSGTTISIEANTIIGKEFSEWIGDVDNIAKITAANTTYLMGNANAEIRANYVDAAINAYNLVVTNGSGSGTYLQGQVVNIEANNSPDGKEFDQWIGDTSIVANVYDSVTTIILQDFNAGIEATYKDLLTTKNDKKLSNIRLLPNPVEESLCISNLNGTGTIEIHSLAGEKITSFEFFEKSIILNVDDLTQGIYLISIFEDYVGREIKKIVVL